MALADVAARNFAQHLQSNEYPGRGIVIGKTRQGQWVQVYWIMGRSPNSQNRVFCVDEGTGRLWTRAADESKVQDPSLIIYTAMCEDNGRYVVTNGDQTDTVLAHSQKSPGNARGYFAESLRERSYEPDAPNYTPRISGVVDLREGQPCAMLSILKRAEGGGEDDTLRQFFEYSDAPLGFGFGMTTYQGNGSPLPSFAGEPLLLPLAGASIDEIADAYWEALNKDNRVSLAVKLVGTKGESGVGRVVVRNRFVAKEAQ